MNVPGWDPGPEVFLLEQHGRLLSLASSLRDRPSRAAADLAAETLRLHAAIEERICFPPLLGSGSPSAGEVVTAARVARGALARALEGPAAPRDLDLAARLGAYAAFEEKRLLPLLQDLPGVTLREMALEVQELVGRRGRARGGPLPQP